MVVLPISRIFAASVGEFVLSRWSLNEARRESTNSSAVIMVARAYITFCHTLIRPGLSDDVEKFRTFASSFLPAISSLPIFSLQSSGRLPAAVNSRVSAEAAEMALPPEATEIFFMGRDFNIALHAARQTRDFEPEESLPLPSAGQRGER